MLKRTQAEGGKNENVTSSAGNVALALVARCPLLAQSGHAGRAQQCPLLEVKRTSDECLNKATQRATQQRMLASNSMCFTVTYVGDLRVPPSAPLPMIHQSDQ